MLKNIESQKKFTELTENGTTLRTSLLGKRSPKSKARFFKDFDNIIHRSFKKIKLSGKEKSQISAENERMLAVKTQLLLALNLVYIRILRKLSN